MTFPTLSPARAPQNSGGADRGGTADVPDDLVRQESTESGREALGWYHERKDEVRRIGLGPAHDTASHGADAFGLMCVAYEEPVPVYAMRIRRPDVRWVV